jgi:hypothetical protein
MNNLRMDIVNVNQKFSLAKDEVMKIEQRKSKLCTLATSRRRNNLIMGVPESGIIVMPLIDGIRGEPS